MKRQLTILLLAVIGGVTITAQSFVPYHPFIKEGKTWNCQEKGRISETINNVYALFDQTTQYSLRICGDTIIDNKTYKKVYLEKEVVDKELVQTIPIEAMQNMERSVHLEKNSTTLYPEFLREENKMVYARRANTNQEFVLYDFSVAEGEKVSSMFPLGEVVVNHISTIVVQEQIFRCFHLSANSGYEPLWVEGIGHPGGPFHSANAKVNDGKIYTLLSCYEDNTCIFTADDFKIASSVSSAKVDVLQTSSKVFDLQGRLTGKPTKGVYIQNGEKRVVR